MAKLSIKEHYCRNGYRLSVCQIGDISHISIRDSNIYPDSDSRSQDYWRINELIIPINDKNDLKEISKLFKLK